MRGLKLALFFGALTLPFVAGYIQGLPNVTLETHGDQLTIAVPADRAIWVKEMGAPVSDEGAWTLMEGGKLVTYHKHVFPRGAGVTIEPTSPHIATLWHQRFG